MRLRDGIVGLGAGLVAVVGVLSAFSATAFAATTFTPGGGSEQQFVVPALVGEVEVTAVGGAGGTAEFGFSGAGGTGASVTATLTVRPGQTLYVDFGGAGGTGGSFGGNGGGASDVRKVSGGPTLASLESRLVVAGGGGGGGCFGGAGGSASGESGGAGAAGDEGAGGGGGGTINAGGKAGSAGAFGTAGSEGKLGQGGGGGSQTIGAPCGAGGGGGGYYGGGGGGGNPFAGAGGGGGSSFVTPGAFSSANFASGAGEPQEVVISYLVGPSGSTGPEGPTGPEGAAGPEGSTGKEGAQGVAGSIGATGATGTIGATGVAGTTGAQGPAGQVELVTCKAVTTGKGKHKKTVQKCTSKLTSSPVKFTTTGAAAAATLTRGGVRYASGSAIRSGGQTKLLLSPRHSITKGSYTLTLTHRGKRSSETITLA